MSTLALETIPSELQLYILEQLSTRSLLIHVTRLSKYWFSLACELVRQRAVCVLGRPGVGLVFETSNPSDYRTRTTYTLEPESSLFEPTLECASSFNLPKLSLAFPHKAPTFNFSLDEDEYFGSLLWTVLLSTQRLVQCRVSPPASPRLVAFDRPTTYYERVSEGLERVRKMECIGEKEKEKRELVGEFGPGVELVASLSGESEDRQAGNQGRVCTVEVGRRMFKVGFERVWVDAAGVVVASEESTRGNEMTVLFCGR